MTGRVRSKTSDWDCENGENTPTNLTLREVSAEPFGPGLTRRIVSHPPFPGVTPERQNRTRKPDPAKLGVSHRLMHHSNSKYDNYVTVHDVLIQYQARILEL